MEKNYFRQTLFVFLAAAILLLLYPYIHQRSPFLQAHFRMYDFWGTFLNSPEPEDTVAVIPTEDTSLQRPQALAYIGIDKLANFFKALRERKEQIRIAYYGDSSIEGDLISQTIRDSLQRRFGGSGVGMVPITTHLQGFRRSVRQSFSGNWFTCKLITNNYRGLPRGISGEYYTIWTAQAHPDSLAADSTLIDSLPPVSVDKTHWVSYGATHLNPGTATIPSARLFYGAIKSDSIAKRPNAFATVKIGEERNTIELAGTDAFNEIWLTYSPCTKIRVDINGPSSLPFYGVSLESQGGVVLDNFSTRGNSGALLTNIPGEVLDDAQALLDYDLVILQFGLNVLNPEMEDYHWYETEMSRVIRHFQTHMPGVPILVMGISDKGTKIDGRMQTDPSVPRITEAQRNAAERSGAAFLSLFEAMGGTDTMVSWVEKEQPPLANRDYAHLNFEGAEKAGQLIIAFLMGGYGEYLQQAGKI